MIWFGESWGAPICVESEHVPVPVGEICIECKDGIMESDAGFILPFLGYGERRFTNAYYHRECFLKCIFGNTEHLRKFTSGEIQ